MNEHANAGSGQAAANQPDRLDSWKEIASYLKRDIRTVQRWEKEEGLPVHRLAHKKRGSVFAHREEIDVWWSQRGGLLDKEESGEARAKETGLRHRLWWIASLGVVVVGAVVVAWLLGAKIAPNTPSAGPVRITASSAEVRALYEKGFRFYWEQHEPSGAIELFGEAWRLDPNCATCAMHLAYAKFHEGHPSAEYQPIAERALHLSGKLPPSERFLNRGFYHEITREREKALAAYKALADLHPGDAWAVEAVAYMLLLLDRAVEAASYWARLVELRPDNFEANVRAACLYYEMGGDEARAGPFIRRARALAPSVSRMNQGRAWIELLAAFEAWRRGDVLEVEQHLQKAEQAYALGKQADWLGLVQNVGLLYMSIGQLEKAERWFHRFQDPSWKALLLTSVAFARNRQKDVLRHIDEIDRSMWTPRPAMLRARFAPDSQTEEQIAWLEKDTNLPKWGVHLARGELAHARGRFSEAISLLDMGLPMIPEAGGGMGLYCLGSETLASALERSGDLLGAVKALEDAQQRKGQTYGFAGSSGYFWMRTQVQLVRLYKKVEREEDARKLGNELLNLLSRADEDNPMLLELRALMKPAG